VISEFLYLRGKNAGIIVYNVQVRGIYDQIDKYFNLSLTLEGDVFLALDCLTTTFFLNI